MDRNRHHNEMPSTRQPQVERLKPIAADMANAAEEAKAKRKAAERPGLKKRAPAAS